MRFQRAVTALLLAVGLALGSASAGYAKGAPVPPSSQGSLTALGGPVWVTFLSKNAALVSEVWFFGSTNPGPNQHPNVTGARFLFANNGAKFSQYNHATAASHTPPSLTLQTIFLGNFAHGTPLVFGLFVPALKNTTFAPKGRWFYTGVPNRNADDNIHAKYTVLNPTNTKVGFEDLCKGTYAPTICSADNQRYVAAWEYNANVFDVKGATVTPEPVSMTLFGTGAAGLAFLRRRRKKQEQQEA
jgi:hypothetical protein